ncbi:hypothetical protein SODALDRAFT_96211 [Sodiomyces alkalinus F11]|uniref:Uncharacterized protein n=1 Tax=Sodiomyces alkalinus (strain CBS 110278 / VKM F-3762 / F11) TaxID=1314773 RepID=A0A3N2Q0Z1_SODAK|nr:hypothetical protein SODALDRAFT_96211 [Sodiomyces alkalinus F11]ROT40429.1 hypothetical protein SODALDRAFT_96211 [Sodiomyces alkalinus F11]
MAPVERRGWGIVVTRRGGEAERWDGEQPRHDAKQKHGTRTSSFWPLDLGPAVRIARGLLRLDLVVSFNGDLSGPRLVRVPVLTPGATINKPATETGRVRSFVQGLHRDCLALRDFLRCYVRVMRGKILNYRPDPVFHSLISRYKSKYVLMLSIAILI